MSDKEEPLSPTLHRIQTNPQQQLQPGLTTIILPPPTTSETLNIHEYQPPVKETEKRVTRGRAATRGTSHSQSPTPGVRRSPIMRTRASSRHEASPEQPLASNQAQPANRSPYLVTRPSPPPVPATFASIMNAYPAPGPGSALESSPSSGNGAPHTNGNGGAGVVGSK